MGKIVGTGEVSLEMNHNTGSYEKGVGREYDWGAWREACRGPRATIPAKQRLVSVDQFGFPSMLIPVQRHSMSTKGGERASSM